VKTLKIVLCVLGLVGLVSAGNVGSSVGVSGSASDPFIGSMCPGSVYCNGEVNGGVDAWTINFGYIVWNSFTLGAATTVTGVSFGVWNFPGDVGGTVDWAILSGGPDPSAGGTVVASATGVSLSTVSLGTNPYGYDLYIDSFSLSQALGAGTYFLALQNAAVASGDPVYWDENDGPSIAWESAFGYLTPGNTSSCTSPGTTGYCSEAFAIYGNAPTTPEPGTLVLGGCGLLLLAGILRRKRH